MKDDVQTDKRRSLMRKKEGRRAAFEFLINRTGFRRISELLRAPG